MVKSPGASPEMKRAKLEVFPDDRRKERERSTQEDIDRYVDALTSFQEPHEYEMFAVGTSMFKHHPNEDIERYFVSSAHWGKPIIPWEIVRPVFLWKLDYVIQTFKKLRRQPLEQLPPPPVVNINNVTPLVFNLDESIEFIMNKARSFNGFPFTWQRLCELLSTPMLHYHYAEKYVRAIDRVINVVTTITAWGDPTDGSDWEMNLDQSTPPHLESVFIGSIDEVEAMDRAASPTLPFAARLARSQEQRETAERGARPAEESQEKREDGKVEEGNSETKKEDGVGVKSDEKKEEDGKTTEDEKMDTSEEEKAEKSEAGNVAETSVEKEIEVEKTETTAVGNVEETMEVAAEVPIVEAEATPMEEQVGEPPVVVNSPPSET